MNRPDRYHVERAEALVAILTAEQVERLIAETVARLTPAQRMRRLIVLARERELGRVA